MIQKKIYSLMLQRGVMTLLLLVLSVTAMWADQAIVVDITGGHNTWSLQVDGEAVTSFNASGEATVSGKNGKTAVLTLTPETGYTVTNFIIYTTYDFLSPSPTRINPGATQIDYGNSGDTYTFTMPADEANGVYIKATIINSISTSITSLSEITDTGGTYIITSDISDGTPGVTTFNGTLEAAIDPETHMPYRISGLSAPLFETLTGTVKNLVLEGVSISSGDTSGNTGAIACEANGAARIYNVGILSGSVGGSGNTGGLVGLLKGTARVINCYSFADITGGSNVGGIVGNNNVASKQNNLATMVMNCIFYGDIIAGTNKSPIYGGNEINNVAGGLNNYNYYRYESPYSKNKLIDVYNRALAMEEKFINRFERYRLLLNSNKKLAAKYASTETVTVEPDDMAKWVLETADLTIAEPMPYPVLKAQGKYPSIINYDANHATSKLERNKGGLLGTLKVTISGVGSNAPEGAEITTYELSLQRTDKDFDRFNYNYDKVQLPYYNDVGTGNYTENKVVTGWKITSINGGTSGDYHAGDEWGAYNFADRNCTNKDLYSASGRVFSQGAYFDVPTGVTGITIEPYWGKAAYVSDQKYDVIYNASYAGQDFSPFGNQYTNGQDVDIHGDGNTQKVYTSIGDARTALSIESGKTVYDYAVVLIGNVHQNTDPTKDNTPYTLMSIDLNHDNEPDCSYIFGHDNRKAISPMRYDFLNIVGIAEAQMPKGASLFRNVSIFNLLGWFEITNTCVVNFSQFEYDNSAKNVKAAAPLILLGGTFQQFVSTQSSTLNFTDKRTQYIHIGSNAWFAKFGNGTHSDGNKFTPHIPISVTGGDYDEFYLSGTYQPNITNMQSDNAECYVSGGRFGEMAASSLEQIRGDVRWGIDYADITNFYGGGTNANNPLTGSIQVDITNSHVATYCGGPKFGDMSNEKTVISNATNCEFGTFFGAGYGGNSYNRVKYYDVEGKDPANYQSNYTDDRGKYFDGKTTNAPGNANYGKKGKGVATDFDYEYFIWSTGKTGARFYVKFISFSLATTKNVTSNLKGCTITGNFYGGGNLGKVDGMATSVLDDCSVGGDVFGGGFSASLPTIQVRKTPAFVAGKEPSKNTNIGMFEMGEINTTEEYQWKHVNALPNNGAVGMEETSEGKYVFTDENLTTLGQVKNSQVTIKGTTTVAGDVYGGGALASMDESGETMVSLIGGTINGNVYGGGQGRLPGTKDENGKDLPEVKALVGSANVELNKGVADGGCVVKGNIFGCNNLNGTPKGSATVHIYKTNGDSRTASEDLENIDETKHHYHLNAVYGGGNLAAYEPTANDAKANVIIDGCDLTSIRTVYGGGNAASTPATSVVVNGTYEIEEVFGGGNGKDALPDGSENPGANVGFKNYSAVEDTYSTKEQRQSDEFVNEYVYGSGEANVTIVGGRVHRVFGGSNTKGNVRITAVTMLDDIGGCDFKVEEAYGGGKSAPMDGEAKLLMSCIPGLKVAYGGAEDANILGDVTLNITNGNFDRVFGGNNISGTIGGKITVNVEETGCSPIIIGQLYGGGNQASYNAHGQTGPTLNIKSFTSIGEVYGGGYGVSATVTGDTHVNINEVKGRFTAGTHNYGTAENPIGVNSKTGPRTISFSEFVRNENGDFLDANGQVTTDESERAVVDQTIQVDIPEFTANKIGGIGMVYGGGNAAKVNGNTHVNIGTQSTIDFVTGVGEASPQTGVAVEGVSIIGNVYGGGNKAEVTGNTNVVVGKSSE